MSITLSLPTGRAPLYHKYPRQFEPQEAYIELDCKNSILSADWNSEIGNAIPFSVYHGHDRRYGISNSISGKALAELLNDPDIISLAQRIVDGYESEWDGNNHIAVLNEDAQTAEDELINRLAAYDDEDSSSNVQVYDVADYLYEARKEIDETTTDEQLSKIVSDIIESSEAENVYIDGDVEAYYNDLRYSLRREKIEEKLDDEDGTGYSLMTVKDENPVYDVRRIDSVSGRFRVFTVYYNSDGEIIDKADEIKTDYVYSYPGGTEQGFEFYTALRCAIAQHPEIRRVHLRSQRLDTNPQQKRDLLMRESVLEMVESERMFDAYQAYGLHYSRELIEQRKRRLDAQRSATINAVKSLYVNAEKQLAANTAKIAELRAEIAKLEQCNNSHQVEIDKFRELLTIRTTEAEVTYQNLLNKSVM